MSSTKSSTLPDLTASEIAVMQALWREGTLAARELHERVGISEGWAYTTTRTVVDRLVAKRLVGRQRAHGLIVYAAAVSRARGLARRLLDLADRVLLVDRAQLVSFLGDSHALTPQDLVELEGLLGTRPSVRSRGKR